MLVTSFANYLQNDSFADRCNTRIAAVFMTNSIILCISLCIWHLASMNWLDSANTKDELLRCAMLTCDHIFLPFLFLPLFYVVSSSRPILSSTNLTWKNFQDALSESKPKMILLQFACIQWPMKLLLKDPGAGFFSSPGVFFLAGRWFWLVT